MFNNIQKRLLIHNPLLWNTRFIPAIIAILLFHIIFFWIGYMEGAVDFSRYHHYSDDNTGTVIFFSVLVSVLFFVVWLAVYTRNNAFKSFYRINSSYLYKEWLIVFLVSMLNVSYSISYLTAKNLRLRTYYSQEEIQKRCETITMASIFIENGYMVTPANGDTAYIGFNKRKYNVRSLMNRSPITFDINNDTTAITKVKTWMQQDNQREIKNVMERYFKLIREHELNTNLTPQSWFALTYHYPEFIDYESIGRIDPGAPVDEYSYQSPTNYTYPHYLPQNLLEYHYKKLSGAWSDPLIEDFALQFMLYFGISFGMLIFGFKVTTGRNVLIAVVSCGLLWIISGVFSIMAQTGMVLPYFWLFLIVGMVVYFFSTISRNQGKGISGIVLNLLLWSLAGFLPIIYGLLMEHYRDGYTPPLVGTINNGKYYIYRPEYEWLNDHLTAFTFINILIVVLAMYFMTKYIKKWKGIAES